MMFKQIFSLFAILLVLAILFLPSILVDIFIVYLAGGYYYRLIYLILFLLVFYLVDLGLNIVIDNLLKIVIFLKEGIYNLVLGIVDIFSSYVVINFLDFIFEKVNLSVETKILIVFTHTLLVFLINNIQTDKNDDRYDYNNIANQKLSPSIEYEISYLLQNEDVFNCIEQIKKKYPDIPKKEIIKTVRKINNENKKF